MLRIRMVIVVVAGTLILIEAIYLIHVEINIFHLSL